MKIDLNADIGESFGNYTIGNDRKIIQYIHSANIACGFHAGDPSILRKTIELALENNVHIGAHPGFPDLIGFGRRKLLVSKQELFDMVLYQVGVVKAMSEAYGGELHHVKPHGAMYNQAHEDQEMAETIIQAVAKIAPYAKMYGMPNSCMQFMCEARNHPFWAEGFADRAYQEHGSLVPRSEPGSVYSHISDILVQVEQMVLENQVQIRDGSFISFHIQTLCVHGDSPHALDVARQIRSFLDSVIKPNEIIE